MYFFLFKFFHLEFKNLKYKNDLDFFGKESDFYIKKQVKIILFFEKVFKRGARKAAPMVGQGGGPGS